MERDKTLINVDRELGWLIANSRVNSWILFDKNQQVILGNRNELDHYIDGYQTADYLKSVKKDMQRGVWFFDKTGSKAVYIHNVFDTRKMIMRQLGTVIFTVDLAFIRDYMSDTGIFSNQDFVVLTHAQQSYATTPSKLPSAMRFLEDHQKQSYQFATIGSEKYYVMSDPITIDNTTFRASYFILNRQIMEKIIAVTVILFIVILFVILLCVHGANYFLKRLITPINILADNMRQFSDSKDLTLLHNKTTQVDGIHAHDEIGILYTSFQKLLDEIDRLVIKDYQSQLLTQTMETKYLMAQIDPHFLYNTLNSINWIALNHNDFEASEMVTSLALLLRDKTNPQKQYDSLSDALSIVQAYIKIQSVRFGDRLRFRLVVPDEVTLDEIKLPKLIIQPIVENAVKYGVERTNRQVLIEVLITITEGKLQIVIFNDGDGFDPQSVRSESTGVGIHNITSRLKLLYGDEGTINIQSAPTDTTTVTIRLPLEKMEE
ncbi:sensor histidine kinase [Lapidilactobacillus luobeiensis]|uniref:sensor histidine kinase n=1 Tax=Lapidilactobacillus luobeiensis TaxID=2950371 RepID=UPI0021C3CC03|nr:histidine kinase [Lapidilactobacillus luobeiensis]